MDRGDTEMAHIGVLLTAGRVIVRVIVKGESAAWACIDTLRSVWTMG